MANAANFACTLQKNNKRKGQKTLIKNGTKVDSKGKTIFIANP